MSKYDKEIEELTSRLKELKELREDEKIAQWPDLTGKYYHPASTTMIKVIRVDQCDEDLDEILVDCMTVRVENENASIDTDTWMTIDMRNEVTPEEFISFYNRAKSIIESKL